MLALITIGELVFVCVWNHMFDILASVRKSGSVKKDLCDLQASVGASMSDKVICLASAGAGLAPKSQRLPESTVWGPARHSRQVHDLGV